MQEPTMYEKGLVQLHDRGIVRRMVELSGDPSADLPPAVDVASPATPVVDVARYQERSMLLHGPSFAGVASGAYQFNCDMDVINQARAVEVESIMWSEIYSGVTHNTWVELWFNVAMGGQVFAFPVAGYLATLTGGARTVAIVVQDEKISKARFDKPLTYTQSTSQDVGESWRINAVTIIWDKVSGSGVLNVRDMIVALKLYY